MTCTGGNSSPARIIAAYSLQPGGVAQRHGSISRIGISRIGRMRLSLISSPLARARPAGGWLRGGSADLFVFQSNGPLPPKVWVPTSDESRSDLSPAARAFFFCTGASQRGNDPRAAANRPGRGVSAVWGSSERGTLTPPTFEAAYVGARNSPWSQPRVWSDFIGSTTSVLCTYSHAGHLKVRNSKPDTAKLMRVSIIRSAWHFGQAAPGR